MMAEELEREPQADAPKPPTPPVIETARAVGDDEWWTKVFTHEEAAELEDMFDQAELEHEAQVSNEVVVCVRIPKDIFAGVFQTVYRLSFEEGESDIDSFGEALADMYMFDDDIEADKSLGVASAYFTTLGDSDVDLDDDDYEDDDGEAA